MKTDSQGKISGNLVIEETSSKAVATHLASGVVAEFDFDLLIPNPPGIDISFGDKTDPYSPCIVEVDIDPDNPEDIIVDGTLGFNTHPIPGATIYLSNINEWGFSETVTDENGGFTFVAPFWEYPRSPNCYSVVYQDKIPKNVLWQYGAQKYRSYKEILWSVPTIKKPGYLKSVYDLKTDIVSTLCSLTGIYCQEGMAEMVGTLWATIGALTEDVGWDSFHSPATFRVRVESEEPISFRVYCSGEGEDAVLNKTFTNDTGLVSYTFELTRQGLINCNIYLHSDTRQSARVFFSTNISLAGKIFNQEVSVEVNV